MHSASSERFAVEARRAGAIGDQLEPNFLIEDARSQGKSQQRYDGWPAHAISRIFQR